MNPTISTPLNPNAKEWRPSPPPTLLHLIYHPPTTLPPPPVQPRRSWFPVPKGRRGALPPRVLRALPPRLRRAASPERPPPPQKRVWIKKSNKAPFQRFGQRRGATRSPPPSSSLQTTGGGATRTPPRPSSLRTSTTVMIKNIPNKLRRDYMLGFLDEVCKIHRLAYDFFYLPMDFGARNNLGYAFANFTTANAAKRFMRILEGYKWDDEGNISKKICNITWARIQGKEAMMRRFQNSNFTCDSLEFLPVVLDPPRNGSDPNPPPPVIVGRLCPIY